MSWGYVAHVWQVHSLPINRLCRVCVSDLVVNHLGANYLGVNYLGVHLSQYKLIPKQKLAADKGGHHLFAL